MGRTLCDYTNRKLRAYVDGGFEFVAARDIVEGHLLCMHKERSGEKYIFSSEYKTVSEILDLFEEVSGVPRPRRRIPPLMMLVFIGSGELLPEPVPPGLSPAFHAGAIRLLQKRRHADIGKAKRELGYRPTGIRAAVHEAHAFHHRRNAIANPLAKRPLADSARRGGGAM